MLCSYIYGKYYCLVNESLLNVHIFLAIQKQILHLSKCNI